MARKYVLTHTKNLENSHAVDLFSIRINEQYVRNVCMCVRANTYLYFVHFHFNKSLELANLIERQEIKSKMTTFDTVSHDAVRP